MLPENISRISLGAGSFSGSMPKELSFAIMDTYASFGGNLIDTAAVYGMGTSEKAIGNWLKERGNRPDIYIATKGGHPSLPDWTRRITESDIRSDMEDSLRNLQTDYVDIYFLHRDDETKPVEYIMPILDRLVREGKTRYIGASNWTASRINEANAFARENGMAEFSVSQILWNGAILNRENLHDKTLVPMDETEHAYYAENHIPVMAYTSQTKGLFNRICDGGYESLPEGLIKEYINEETKQRAEKIMQVSSSTGISPTAVSLAYLLNDKNVKAYPIIGTSKPERIIETMKVFSLGQKELEILFA